MRNELEQIKNLTVNTVNKMNKIYSAIDEIKRTVREDMMRDKLRPQYETIETTAEEYYTGIDKAAESLKMLLENAAKIRKEDINLDVMAVIKELKPSADELTQICNDYKNNQTMLRLIREYIHANGISGVIIPAINADRVTALNRICDNLKGCAKVAADYNSPLHTRQFEHIANNFDSVFEKDLAIID